MTTTREQAEAYAYASRRMSTTLLRGADEARQDPRRRLNRSLGGGLAVGVLIMAGFGIAGWLGGGGGPALPSSGAVVVGDHGDPYVVRDGVVHPALNLSSALLAGDGQLTEVREEKLDDAPRGRPLGIEGAPDVLPGADDLVDAAWTLCATPSETGGDPVTTALYVAVAGVAPGTAATATGGETVLVETEDEALWLLAEGRRYAVDPGVVDRLGLSAPPVRLTRAIIATVPGASPITVPDPLPDHGEPPEVELPFDAAVGDVAHTAGGGVSRRHYLVRSDGLVAVSELGYALRAGDAGREHEITSAQAAPFLLDQGPPDERTWPDAVPAAAELEHNQPVCVTTPPGGVPGDAPWQATVHLPRTMPEPPELTPVTSSGGSLGALDQIYLPAGSGALVRAIASAGAAGTYTLVTDAGTAYPCAGRVEAEHLGYDPDRVLTVPREYVGLLPRGPLLDREAATQEQRGEDQ